MAQATITSSQDSDNSESTESPQSTDSSDESRHYVEYLDVNSMRLIRGLAATLQTEDEVKKYIQAEEARWNRVSVLRILRRRLAEIGESS